MMTHTTWLVLALVGLLVTNAGTFAEPIAAAEPFRIGTETQIFVDDHLISNRSNVIRRTHPARKLSAPVLEPETAWELEPQVPAGEGIDERLYVYGTVIRDPETGVFRMWYNRIRHVLYATSEDGLHWERPDLGFREFRGSTANNLVNVRMHSPSVVYDERATDGDQRYVMFGSGYVAAHSPDGLTWRMYPKNPVFPGGDTCTLAQDPQTGEFLAFHKRTHEHRGRSRRLVYLATSPDMQDWSEAELVMAPDQIDDAQTQAEGGRWSQFYNMSAFPYAGQWLGLVTHFRYSGPPEKRQGPSQSGDDGPIDVQLVHSRDGRTWHRCDDRSPVIPTGPHAYDAGSILGVANAPVVVGDELWVYYTAMTTTHGGYLPDKRMTIALARWRLDGMVSLDAGRDEGIVETVPLETAGERLSINADAAGGAIWVEVLDTERQVMPGYSRQDSVAVRSDNVRHEIRWANHDTLPQDKVIRLRFHQQNASLYSFQVVAGR